MIRSVRASGSLDRRFRPAEIEAVVRGSAPYRPSPERLWACCGFNAEWRYGGLLLDLILANRVTATCGQPGCRP